MVDLNIEQMKEYLEYAQKLKELASSPIANDAIKRSLQETIPYVEKYTKTLKSMGVSVAEFAEKAKNLSFANFISGLSAVKQKVLDAVQNIDLFSDKLADAAMSAGLLYAAASGRLVLNEELIELGKTAGGASAQMDGMFGKILQLAPEIGEAFGDATDLAKGFFKQANVAKNMETALLMNAAAAGNLDTALGSLDGGMSGLTDMTLEFSRLTSEAGTANNVTAAQAANYATQLMKIPGALGMVVEGAGATSEQTNMLDATMRVAAGTFQKFENVMKDVNLLFLNWNKTGQDSLTFVARMHSAAQSLKMPMDTMRQYVHGVGEQFKFLGDNTMSAIDIMTKMGPAFKSSGLGPDAISQLVKGMTKGVADMDVAQMSFISSRTGGPGGLQGGYQIEQQIAEGDLEGVMGKVEDTLRGMFGGQVVTLKQASEDARSAAQYTKQVQMLTSGPLKVAGSKGEAKAILDAMSKGEIFTPKGMGETTPEENLEDAINQGNDIQDRQLTELVRLNNIISHKGVVAGSEAYETTRGLVGSGSEEGAAKMKKIRMDASAVAAGTRFQETQEKGKKIGLEEEKAKLFGELKGVGKSIGNALGGLADTLIGKKKAERTRVLGEDEGAGAPLLGGGPASGPDMVMDLGTGRLVPRTPGTAPVRAGAAPRPRESKRAAQGQENTVVIQVRSDDQIKRIVKFMIDEDGNMRQIDEGKVVPGTN